MNENVKNKKIKKWAGTHVSFVVAGLKDELLGVMLPVLHRGGRGGLVGRAQRDRLAPFAGLEDDNQQEEIKHGGGDLQEVRRPSGGETPQSEV